jgi:CHAD domain-containing protein
VTALKFVQKPTQTADTRLRKADGDIDQLHRARKATKRARYAAELVEPVDKEMKTIEKEAEELQTLLGEHQDAVVSATFLSTISASGNGQRRDSGFTYGVLMANELNRAAQIRASLQK